jgi:DUF971 family protein
MPDPGMQEPFEVITLRKQGLGLALQLRGGERVEIDARVLRARCRCSVCFHAARSGGQLETGTDISILEVRQVGSTGLQAVFSDGHERGIYPWSYLYEIARTAGGEI